MQGGLWHCARIGTQSSTICLSLERLLALDWNSNCLETTPQSASANMPQQKTQSGKVEILVQSERL